MPAIPCPCGGPSYDACCGPLHRRTRFAETAVELMRSRYSAFAVGGRIGEDHLFRTWHPAHRPDETSTDSDVTWTGLDIVEVVAGGPADDDGIVEFVAHHTGPDGEVRERSSFTRRAGKWVYVSAI